VSVNCLFSKYDSNPLCIRGASAIVNSARLALGVEALGETETAKALAAVGAQEGRAIKMSVLKANGSVSRKPVVYAWPTGKGLVDVTERVGSGRAADDLVDVIAQLNQRGERVTKTGEQGIDRFKSSDWPESIRGLGRDKLRMEVQRGLNSGALTLEGTYLRVSETMQ